MVLKWSKKREKEKEGKKWHETKDINAYCSFKGKCHSLGASMHNKQVFWKKDPEKVQVAILVL